MIGVPMVVLMVAPPPLERGVVIARPKPRSCLAGRPKKREHSRRVRELSGESWFKGDRRQGRYSNAHKLAQGGRHVRSQVHAVGPVARRWRDGAWVFARSGRPTAGHAWHG